MTDPWILTSLIHRDLDDGDQYNALILAERLFAMNKANDYYRFIYAKCLYTVKDYSAVYAILKDATDAPNVTLFAKSCLELGIMEQGREYRVDYWKQGIEALKKALPNVTSNVYWREELASASRRHYTPSKASMYNLLGDLYAKLDYIQLAADAYMRCLELNPFKLTAYTKLCDIAPDIPDFKLSELPKDIFKDFDTATTDLEASSSNFSYPSSLTFQEELSFNDGKDISSTVQVVIAEFPDIVEQYRAPTLDELRQLTACTNVRSENEPNVGSANGIRSILQRDPIGTKKQNMLSNISDEISKMESTSTFENKHGIYKKPTENADDQTFRIALDSAFNVPSSHTSLKRAISDLSPPRSSQPRRPKRSKANGTQITAKNSQNYTTPSSISTTSKKGVEEGFLSSILPNSIIESMNRVLKLLRIIATGYLYRSFCYSEAAVLELQQLEDNQFNSPRILALIGQSYYDKMTFKNARVFFKHAFAVAPWFLDHMPVYSTTLWYLGKGDELDLLAYSIKDNLCHRYEVNFVAGNWEKCLKRNETEALQWFQKAVNANPTCSYAYVAVGHQYARLGDHLNAMRNYKEALLLDRRSSVAWFSMSMTHIALGNLDLAKGELMEAIRLHPNHHIMLRKLAELLVEEDKYEEALKLVNQSLNIRQKPETLKLKKKIEDLLSNSMK